MPYLRWNPSISPIAVAIREAGKPVKLKATPKSLFNLTFSIPNYGIGEKFTRFIWKHPGFYWQITKVVPNTQEPLMKSGKIYGIFHKFGKSEGKVREVRSPRKEQWFVYNEDFYKTFEKSADVWKRHWELVKKLDKEAREKQGFPPSKFM